MTIATSFGARARTDTSIMATPADTPSLTTSQKAPNPVFGRSVAWFFRKVAVPLFTTLTIACVACCFAVIPLGLPASIALAGLIGSGVGLAGLSITFTVKPFLERKYAEPSPYEKNLTNIYRRLSRLIPIQQGIRPSYQLLSNYAGKLVMGYAANMREILSKGAALTAKDIESIRGMLSNLEDIKVRFPRPPRANSTRASQISRIDASTFYKVSCLVKALELSEAINKLISMPITDIFDDVQNEISAHRMRLYEVAPFWRFKAYQPADDSLPAGEELFFLCNGLS